MIHSYSPGEVTPEQAHAIGLEFARRLLGERYEVVVATHIDREHLHCHILFNSVSFVDGRKYRNSFKDYYGDIRGISNEISAAHGLSVIQPTEHGKHYAEWNAKQTGKTTVRDLVRLDIDRAIASAFTLKTFWAELERMGYTVKRGSNIKHTALKPPGGTRFVRLSGLGAGYSENEIKARLSTVRTGQEQPVPRQKPVPKRYTVIHGKIHRPRKKLTGFMALYVHYLYVLGVRKPYQKRKPIPFVVRQEVTKLHRYQQQFQFVRQNHIENAGQLLQKSETLQMEIDTLTAQRKMLYQEKRNGGDAENQITGINEQLRTLRRELRLCMQIAEDSPHIKAQLEALKAERQKQTEQQKEVMHNGCKWRSR